MNLPGYLFTVNKNQAFSLDPDELKDVQQDISVYCLGKTLNNEMLKKTIIAYYRRAVSKKQNWKKTIASQPAFQDLIEEPTEPELIHNPDQETKRKQQIAKMNLSPIQKKILKELIAGKTYDQVRKKFNLSSKQLRDHCHMIKRKNSAESQESSKTVG